MSYEGDEFSNVPLGILYLAANLRKNGFDVTVLDPTPMGLSLEDIIEKIAKIKPMLIGISSMTPGIKAGTMIAAKIREVFGKSIPVCLGGAHINVDPTFIDRFPYFDFAIIGESEVELAKNARIVAEGGHPKGVMYAEAITDLDSLPFPARDLLETASYHRPENRSDKPPSATIFSSRGCPFGCIFCSRPSHRRGHRVRSPGNVVDEMESLAAAHGNDFSFTDDSLTLNRKSIMGICDEIIRRGLKYRWSGSTRAPNFDDELAAKMRAAGCDDIVFGVESGNERIRNEIVHKGVTDEQIFKALKVAKKNGMRTNILLMLGFPTETMKEVEDTVNFGRRSQADIMGIRITKPLPGSDIYEIAIKNGSIPADLVDRFVRGELGETFIENWPHFIPDGLTMDDLVAAKKRAYRAFYLDPRWLMRRAWYTMKHPSHIKQDLALLKIAPYVFKTGKTKTTWA